MTFLEFWIDPTDSEGNYAGDALTEHPRQGDLVWQESLIHVREVSNDLDVAIERLEKFLTRAVKNSDGTHIQFRKYEISDLLKEIRQARGK